MKRYVAASSSRSIPVFDHWSDAYTIIEYVVKKFSMKVEPEEIDSKIDTLNSILKGDSNWDEAYARWNASAEDEGFVGGN